MDEDENFWPASAPSQGPDGVCGPCSEIYVATPRGSVEVWNLVFTQFNRVGAPPNNLRPLPSKNIDTGMGFERMASVLQGVETNYHIDILRPLVEAAGEVCHVKYEPESDDEIDRDNGRRLRRIADHVRACSFAIHENVYPDNEKQGYVIRKLIRRAVLDGYQMGIHEAFLYQLPKVVADLMKGPYPELQETVERVAQGLRNEESQFFEVINAGMPRVERLFEETKKAQVQDRLRPRDVQPLADLRLPAGTDRDAGRGTRPRTRLGRLQEGPAEARRGLRRRAAERTVQAGAARQDPRDAAIERVRGL